MPTARTIGRAPEGSSDRGELERFLKTARERFQRAADAEREIRALAREDFQFYAGEQWPGHIQADRASAGRPCLTFNRLPQFAKQIINEERQSRPQIQVNPKGDGATVELAQILQGLTRHIEVASDAEIAEDTAFEHMVIGGFGHIRVITENSVEMTGTLADFDQEIRIKRILNPFTVYFDPAAQEPDYSDARWAFIIEDFSVSDYKSRFPGSALASLSDFRSIGDDEREWFGEGTIRVAEYFRVEKTVRKRVALENGTTAWLDELPDVIPADQPGVLTSDDGEIIVREVEVPTVYWDLINARERLKSRIWPGRYIPIIPVLGEELIVDGKRFLSGIVRHAKDAQRDYNFERSALVEAIALAPRAPWIVPEGAIEGYEQLYEAANRKNIAVLYYKPKDVGGQLVPPPARNVAEAPIRDLTVAVAQADNDMKATTGIYDAALGARGPQESGKAIIARKTESDVANFHFVDNMARSIRHLGRILLDLIPKIYDRPGRIARIVNPDQTHKVITLNQAFTENGKELLYDLKQGTFDVTVSVGPGYESKRQEFVQSVLALVQSAPQIAQFIMDLVVRHMDWPGAAEIADRLKKALPPNMQEDPCQGGRPQLPPEFAAKFEQLLQQQAALTEALNQANEVIRTKKIELDAQERMNALREETKLLIAQLKVDSQEAIEGLRQQLAAINRKQAIDEQIQQPQPAAPVQQAA